MNSRRKCGQKAKTHQIQAENDRAYLLIEPSLRIAVPYANQNI